MIPHADIICLSKDWHEPSTSNHHVMEHMARNHRVLWVNSIATRAPNLGSANDLRKIVRKITNWFRGVEHISPNLRVFTPVVLPFPGSRLAQVVNRRLVRWGVNRAARRWGLVRPHLWIFLPNAVDYIGSFGESRVIYYCVDEWSQFTHLDGGLIRAKEGELLKRADTVFVVSHALLAEKALTNPSVHLIPHGVDQALFSRALASGYTPASELGSLRHPVVGFYGTIYDWVDQTLITAMARLRPDWSFVLVGKVMTDVSALCALPNIHMVGHRPHHELPRFCRGFDVGIIPYRMQDPRMQSVNPLKLREYLAAGLPVVTVDLPEARHVDPDVATAANPEQFIRAIEEAVRTDTADRRRHRSERMTSHTWDARVMQIEQTLAKTAPARGTA